MKTVLFVVIMIVLGNSLFAQKSTLLLQGDSVKVTNCDSAELIIENHTQAVSGFLFNTGNGRTIFKRGAIKINDSMYIIGGDTLKIKTPPGYVFSTGLTNNANTITANLSTGIAGGQSAIGGTAAGEALTLSSTINTTKGKILMGFSGYDEANNLLGVGTSSPAHLLDLSQTLTGSNAISAINILDNWRNMTGTPTAFKLSVTDTSSITTINPSSNIVDIQENGISRLKIPVSSARMLFSYSGINLQTPGGTPGGISFNGSPTSINAIVVSKNFILGNSDGLSVPGDGLDLTSAVANHTTGTVNVIRSYSLFQPVTGNGAFNMLNLNSTLNQTGGANGITRGLYVNPLISSALDFRAIEVATGKSILNGNVSVNTSLSPTAELLIGAGTAAAGTSPIKLIAGTILTTPEDGAIEYDGTDYYITQGTNRYKLSKTLTGQLATDFGAPSVAAGNTASTTLSVPGVATGDVVMVNANSGSVNPPSITITAFVTAANTVTLRAYNAGSSAVTLASDTYKVRIIK